ncbi:MAG: hypothetical protein COA78_17900 [Blastopirellula sp.]|nr:MAG: hypothetical protein COA78_17900 [Blastopirellula sp.]
MSIYICKECKNEQAAIGGMKPYSCSKCQAKGDIWTEASVDSDDNLKSADPNSSGTTSNTKLKPSGTGSLYQCKKCGNEQAAVGGMQPYSCSKCKAKGEWNMPTGTPPPKPSPTIKTSPPIKTSDKPKYSPAPSVLKKPAIPKTTPVSPKTTPASNDLNTSTMPSMPSLVTKPRSTDSSEFITNKSKQVSTSESITKQEPAVLESQPPKVIEPSSEVTEPPSDPLPISKRIVWSYPDIKSHALPQRSLPLLSKKNRLYLTVENKLIAFDCKGTQPTELWTYNEAAKRISSSPVIGPDGHIRIHSSDGFLHIVSSEGKHVCKPVQIEEPLGWSTPVVDENNSTWICGCHGGLYRVDAHGKADFSPFFRGRQRMDSTGLIHDNIFYAGAENGCVYSIPLTESRGKNQWNHLNEEGRTGWFINSSLALSDGPTLIVSSRDDHLYGFQLDGTKLWSLHVNGQMLGSPVVDIDGSIYVGLSINEGREKPVGAMIRVDGNTHKIRWRFDTDSPVESSPVIGENGNVYFGDNDGWIYAVDSDGKELWSDQMESGVRSPGSLIGNGRVLFGLENGKYVALECEDNFIRSSVNTQHFSNLAQST